MSRVPSKTFHLLISSKVNQNDVVKGNTYISTGEWSWKLISELKTGDIIYVYDGDPLLKDGASTFYPPYPLYLDEECEIVGLISNIWYKS